MTTLLRALVAMSVTLTAFAALPAMAQNSTQIAQVKAGASCPRCNLFQADLTGLEKNGLNLSGSRLRQADLTLAVMNRTQLSGADLRDINAYGAVLASSNLSGADLSNASLVGAWLQGINWSGAKLEGANLAGSDLSRARNLTQQQLSRACGDASTRLPINLTIPTC